ncbi:alpha/beta fold hydrolase [Pseudomonas sp. 5P_3.1_Bac2]|uniref:alpha/beta fold hydrolase n=1 Tax=Pseudomonas sp. 5P_3.1_Bac2 TaxID=2971617 RepID=UPI0021C64425|nr:alpha/beta hydrolase [Pseudomonas sp. 5P_3.1_Bac2]MCU1717655.1 alpha/beta fold hydrolase [Pseudomonas sp. 5P_3.1_Bac2]
MTSPTTSSHQPIPLGQFAQLSSGHRVHYHEVGRASAAKPTLVFLHGSGPGASGYSNFHLNYPFFAELGYHVLVPDYLGYGLSDKPQDLAYTSALHVQVLHELLAQKGVSKVVLIGNSLGGAISFQYALSYPEQVSKLVVMGPGGVENPALWAAEMSGLVCMGAFIQQRKSDRESFRELLHHIVASAETITEAVIDSRLPIWLEQPMEVFSTMKVEVFADRLAELQMPVLCLWGQKDNFLPVRHALQVADKVADVRVVISSRSGHWFMLEEPDYFNHAVLNFLG